MAQFSVGVNTPGLFWNKTEEQLDIGLEVPDDVLEFLNANDEIKDRTRKALKKIYRYEGPFVFTFDIPF